MIAEKDYAIAIPPSGKARHTYRIKQGKEKLLHEIAQLREWSL
jgi:hypothetical protein